jgi:hypothetical protein
VTRRDSQRAPERDGGGLRVVVDWYVLAEEEGMPLAEQEAHQFAGTYPSFDEPVLSAPILVRYLERHTERSLLVHQRGAALASQPLPLELEVEASTGFHLYLGRLDETTLRGWFGNAQWDACFDEGPAPERREPSPPESTEVSEVSDATGTPVRGAYSVLEDSRDLSRMLLLFLQHFGGLPLDTELLAQAEDGLDDTEIRALVGEDAVRRDLTDRFTQAWLEYEGAGGSGVARFGALVERVLEQVAWGNDNAVSNLLEVGYGTPENVLGLVHRRTHLQLYDEWGEPLSGLSGVGYRDHHYRGAPRPEPSGEVPSFLEIDDATAEILGILFQVYGEPFVVIGRAAEIYFSNIETVNEAVLEGLSEDARDMFLESLPMFLGFLGGHALTAFLMRMSNPWAIGTGLALEGLLRAAEWILQIGFAGSAMDRLSEAAYHLSRVRTLDDVGLTALSEYHVEAAAEPIRQMVLEIAMAAGTVAIGIGLRAIRRGLGRGRIRCTDCALQLEIPYPNRSPHPDVPPYVEGGPTSGILRVGPAERPLTSGYSGPSAGLPSGTPGMHGNIKSHVEAHAAAVMRLEGLEEAVLFINRIPCTTPRPPGCMAMLERMLPEGGVLHVYGPEAFYHRFVGIAD